MAWGGHCLSLGLQFPSESCNQAFATQRTDLSWPNRRPAKLFDRYGRFPVYLTPYRTVLGFQACHLDAEFYDRFYRPEALCPIQRKDFPKRRE